MRRVKPLRFRTIAVFHPLVLDTGGYSNEFYDLVYYSGFRPYRFYRDHMKRLFSRFVLDDFRFENGDSYYFFELPPGADPAPLPGHLADLKAVADMLVPDRA